ncbi:MAG: 3,4-dioxygenase subunit beta [Actinomycetota bacterium]|nr:3,4-dioxygenase subunit beta [Actinomycetota bacterium]
MEHEHDDWDRGLAFDMQRMMHRRGALKALAGAGALAFLAACGKESTSATTTAGSTASTTASTTAGTTATTAATTAATSGALECTTVVPEETAGPYPGDGSNGPDILADPAVVRSDITGSFGDYTGTATGVATTISLTVLDSSNGCAPLASGAVYLWHADKDGHYSMYTAPDANYLRGVGEADANGMVTFRTIWPGCYDGRWPHIHFEVYPSIDDALAAANTITTSQIALPEAECQTVYATSGYESSVSNLGRTSLESDNVFRDGWEQELATVTGSNDAGWTVSLTITV